MREVAINYSNTEELINKLRVVLNNLDNEKREISNALSELYDLQNYYSNKGSIVDELESKQGQINRDIETTESLIMSITSFMQEVREKDERLAYKFKQDIKEYAKNNKIDLVSDVDRFLDKLQTGLDIAGFIPIVGDIGDGINAFISLLRGDVSGAILSAVSILPFGDAVKGLKYIDNAKGLLKLGDKAVDIGKGTEKLVSSKAVKNIKKEAIGILNKGESSARGYVEATMGIGKNDYVLFLKNKPDVKVNLLNDGINPKGQAIAVGGCLTGDTLIKTDTGYKEIREISTGDLVLSKAEEDGIIEYKKVIQKHKNSTYESCIIKTKNSKIEATTGHLFMIKNKWWISAINIKEKDFIELSNNNYEEVVSVELKKRSYPISTYNISVEDNHTYYVGEEKILTHNTIGKNACFEDIVELGYQPKAKKIISERVNELDLNEYKLNKKQLSSKKMTEIKKKINNRTATKEEYELHDWHKRFSKRRREGVKQFWNQERERIINGERTTRDWSEEQRKDILNGRTPKYNGKPIQGHHSYSASKYPHLADKGEIIYPATPNEHLKGWHGGNFKNSKPGEQIIEIIDF